MSVDVTVNGELVARGERDLPTIITIECRKSDAWLAKVRAALPLSVCRAVDRVLVAIRRLNHESFSFASAAVNGQAVLVFQLSQRSTKGEWHRVWRAEAVRIVDARVRITAASQGSLSATLETRCDDAGDGDIRLATEVVRGRGESSESFSGVGRTWVCTAHARPAPDGKRIAEFGLSGFVRHRRTENRGWEFGGGAWSVDLRFQDGGLVRR